MLLFVMIRKMIPVISNLGGIEILIIYFSKKFTMGRQSPVISAQNDRSCTKRDSQSDTRSYQVALWRETLNRAPLMKLD